MKTSFFIRILVCVLLFFSIISCENKIKSTIIHENKISRHGHTEIYGNNKIIIIAGLTKKLPINSIEIFNIEKNIFEKNISLQFLKRGWHRTSKLQKDFFLISGGWTNGNLALRESVIVEMPSFQIKTKSDLNIGRYDHTSTPISGTKILITGGNDGKKALRSMEIFDFKKSKFTMSKQPMYLKRQQHTATLLKNNNILILGGTSDNKTSYAEIYELKQSRTKLVKTPLNNPRSRHTSTLLIDGRVLITGGLGPKRTLNTAETFNPKEKNVTLLKNRMAESRQQHTSTLLPDGRVAIIGGWGGVGKTLDSVEIFYPTLNCFKKFGFLSQPRRFHSASLIGNNRILVVGGASDDKVHSNSETISLGEKKKKISCN
ncbi:MAG: kelch repeat-containing protein [Nitrospinota bacterium]|nr:kelch repeat-containing protein [Nitrospinota bacterium]